MWSERLNKLDAFAGEMLFLLFFSLRGLVRLALTKFGNILMVAGLIGFVPFYATNDPYIWWAIGVFGAGMFCYVLAWLYDKLIFRLAPEGTEVYLGY